MIQSILQWCRRRAQLPVEALAHTYSMGWARGFNVVLASALVIWCLEWLIFVEYLLGEYYRTYIVFPIRTPLLLILSIFYWLITWGLLGWRRAQFGRFTRGERRLWAKGYAAFWVVEFVTIASFIIIYLWLSWGPAPLVGRMIILPRRGLVLEFIVYSYLLFLAYAAKLSIHWNLWTFQRGLALAIVLAFGWLLWRDVCALFTREPFLANVGTHWRKLTLGALVHSLSNEWWLQHTLGPRHPHVLYAGLDELLASRAAELRAPGVPIAYVAAQRIARHSLGLQVGLFPRVGAALPTVDPLVDVLWRRAQFYPTRVGFVPKRMAMWQLLTVLKMWHHLVILLWWMLYLFRLAARRRTSYSFLAVCYFNVYCCYLLGLMIYIVYYAAAWEVYLRVRPANSTVHRHVAVAESSLLYIWRGFRCGRSHAYHSEPMVLLV